MQGIDFPYFPYLEALFSKLRDFDLRIQVERHSTIAFYTNKIIPSLHCKVGNSSRGCYHNNQHKYKSNCEAGRSQGCTTSGHPKQNLSRGNGKTPVCNIRAYKLHSKSVALLQNQRICPFLLELHMLDNIHIFTLSMDV